MLVAERESPDSGFQELSLSSRLLGWFSNSLPGVYDRALRRVVLLDGVGMLVGWHTKTVGDALVWARRPAEAKPLRQPVPK